MNTLERRSEATVIEVARPIDADVIALLDRALELVRHTRRPVLLDLSGCRSIDVASLSLLVCRSRKAEIFFIVPRFGRVKSTISLAGFANEMRVFDDLQSARVAERA